MIYVVLAIGAASALAWLLRRMWAEAALVLIAALSLAAMIGGFSRPGEGEQVVDAASGDVAQASAVTVEGDGLRAAQWADLPARPLRWTEPKGEVLRLEFARELARGRVFTLTLRRTENGPARLQLLAENGQVLAEQKGSGTVLSVSWLPPVAERMVLQAKLLDAQGKAIAQGPVPLVVTEAEPLRVTGRFAAPSFDLQALHRMLEQSGAVVDWRVVLGKTVTRTQAPREEVGRPDLMVVDAAYFERLAADERIALMGQVAGGVPLLVLGANASDAGAWRRAMQLSLKAQASAAAKGTPLPMDLPALVPAASGPWLDAGGRLTTRAWKQGRVTWLAATGWHRYAITEPQALALWWQDVIDAAGAMRKADAAWSPVKGMPLPGERLEVCAQGVRGNLSFPSLAQEIAWQRRPDQPDALCAAVWPRQPGWLEMRTQGENAVTGYLYVYDRRDWPAWQAAQRRDATVMYAARTPGKPVPKPRALPAWPFALLFAAAMLALWWRERR